MKKIKTFLGSLNYMTLAVLAAIGYYVYQNREPLYLVLADYQLETGYSLVAIIAFLLFPAINTFLHRGGCKDDGPGQYFTQSDLMEPPHQRPAYSDRTAYIMAELSDLAYYAIEPNNSLLEEFADKLAKADVKDQEQALAFLRTYNEDAKADSLIKVDKLKAMLGEHGFNYVGYFNRKSTQGFVCLNQDNTDAPYIVVAFRGTEKKVEDWLTDANAVPKTFKANSKDEEEIKVHKGFYDGYNLVKKDIDSLLTDAMEQLTNPGNCRIFLTGHSLGGALAMVTTREMFPDIDGACYNFGAPRVGNYAYFDSLKTPVYRVVNSSDIVPRVPPGALIVVIQLLLRGLKVLVAHIPFAKKLITIAEDYVDQLNGYRHCGDLRYLTDVASGRFHETRLLSNPPVYDRWLWFWRHLKHSLFTPVRSHSMSIYRNKLREVALARKS